MILTADFETTTEAPARVWATGLCEIANPDNFIFGNSIDWLFDWLNDSEESHTLYFHNLRFDGQFILFYLFTHGYEWTDEKNLKQGQFKTLISDMGLFYSITVCFEDGGKDDKKEVTFLDSLKILNFSVKQIAKGFGLPIMKGEIDYKAERPIGHELTQEEVDYLRNDVQIVAMALAVLFKQGLKKMTAGSNAFHDFKTTFGKKRFEKMFPIPENDKEIREAYKGGFTYLNPAFAEKEVFDGHVFDVNSLYPSVMYYKMMPFGVPVRFTGRYEDDKLYPLYVQRIKCQFELKPGKIPTIQLKGNLAFIPTQYLSDSADEIVEMTLTNVDLKLFFEQYEVYNIEYLDGFKFMGAYDLFKDYIDKWTAVKIESTKTKNAAMRSLAKLMLNSLYGKFSLNPKVQSKVPYFDRVNKLVKYKLGPEEEREPIYVPVGAFITSYAREVTIRASQAIKDLSVKKYGKDMYIYSDTDSIHTLLPVEDVETIIETSDTELGKWAHESDFVAGKFLHQKCYCEAEIVNDEEYASLFADEETRSRCTIFDGVKTFLKVTSAGMSSGCYKYVTWENFRTGEAFRGKLLHQNVEGGAILKDVDFTIK